MKPRLQSLALAALGIADLISTLFFIGAANAAEANPLMARILQLGPAAFIQAKLLLLLVPLAILEIARRKNPEFVARAMNAAIVAYVGLYTVGVAHLNRPYDLSHLQSASLNHAEVAHRRVLMGLPPRPPLKALTRAAAQKAGAFAARPPSGEPVTTVRGVEPMMLDVGFKRTRPVPKALCTPQPVPAPSSRRGSGTLAPLEQTAALVTPL